MPTKITNELIEHYVELTEYGSEWININCQNSIPNIDIIIKGLTHQKEALEINMVGERISSKNIDYGTEYFPNADIGYSTIIDNTPIEVDYYVKFGCYTPKSYSIHINCKNNIKNINLIIEMLNHQREILWKKQANANQDN